MSDSPVAVLFDEDGIAMAVEDGVAIPANTRALIVAGTDGTNALFVKVTAARRLVVDGSEVTQPISAASLPLPTGAATEATLAGVARETTLDAIKDTDGIKKITDALPAGDNSIGRVRVRDAGGDQLEVETGAARATLYDQSGNAVGVALDGSTYRLTVQAKLRKPDDSGHMGDAANPVRVDPTGTTTQPISATSLPLPTGASTEASLAAQSLVDNAAFTDGTTRVQPVGFIFDEVAGTALTENDAAAARIDTKRAQIYVLEDETTRGRRLTITAANAAKVDGSAVTQPISAASLPLPTGAATAALQTQPGVDIGDVTINNTGGGGAVPIQDGGNSITIDATALPLPTGAATEASLAAQSLVDNAAFTDGTSRVVPSGHIFDEVAGTALTENDVAASRIDSKRAQIYVLEDETTRGRRLTITAANAAKVDGSAVTQPISAASLPLPTGAATEATLATRLADATFTGRINTLGQKTMANSTPVVLSSDQTVIPVSDNGGSLTVDTPQLPAALVGSRLDVNNGAWLGSTAPTVGQKTMANSIPIVIASDQSAVTIVQATAANLNAQVVGPGATGAALSGNPVRVAGSDGTNTRNILTDTTGRLAITSKAATTSVTSVASSTSNVTVLASNTNRLGATVHNDTNKSMYLKLGATASATSFTVKIPADGYFEVPYGYTGILDALWAAGVAGSARVTEVTA